MERSIAACLATIAVISPWLVQLIPAAWPRNTKKIAVYLIAGLFSGMMIWIFLAVKGEPAVIVLIRVLVPAYSLFGLLVLHGYWQHDVKNADVGMVDVVEALQKAIDTTEKDLKLSPIEHLEKLRPVEGVYRLTLVRYADGTWLEWVNPTDEKGVPDQSYFAVYSNNSRVVKRLVQLVGRYCNIEQQKKPLWQ